MTHSWSKKLLKCFLSRFVSRLVSSLFTMTFVWPEFSFLRGIKRYMFAKKRLFRQKHASHSHPLPYGVLNLGLVWGNSEAYAVETYSKQMFPFSQGLLENKHDVLQYAWQLYFFSYLFSNTCFVTKYWKYLSFKSWLRRCLKTM